MNAFHSLTGATLPAVFAGQANDPVFLATATHSYRLQSQLHIPNRFGFFSSGPPHLQVYETGVLINIISTSFYNDHRTIIGNTFLQIG